MAATLVENSGSTFSEEARESLLQLGSSWKLEVIDGASHFLPMEFSNSVVERIQSYILDEL